ncbi:hypothetical protein DAEQUDRAFT_413717 [Daedalea quercina L-15889]|uniref:Uncharacterized protein n=1 Tax=Daedalea quercina L-15889 TaxID=1314783 RepID=A0A165THU7_9APHY|nr:hypothetical protein DAEQUDRAFT_413717 [Daedalea quercina L-15889]
MQSPAAAPDSYSADFVPLSPNCDYFSRAVSYGGGFPALSPGAAGYYSDPDRRNRFMGEDSYGLRARPSRHHRYTSRYYSPTHTGTPLRHTSYSPSPERVPGARRSPLQQQQQQQSIVPAPEERPSASPSEIQTDSLPPAPPPLSPTRSVSPRRTDSRCPSPATFRQHPTSIQPPAQPVHSHPMPSAQPQSPPPSPSPPQATGARVERQPAGEESNLNIIHTGPY